MPPHHTGRDDHDDRTRTGGPGGPRAAPGRTPPRVLVTHDADRAAAALGRLLTADRLLVGRPTGDFAFRMVTGTTGPLTVVTAHLGTAGWADSSPPAVAPGTGALVTSVLLAGTASFAVEGHRGHPLAAGEVWRLEPTSGLHVTYGAGATFADLVLPLPVVADAAVGALGRDVAEDADGRPVVRFVTHRPVDGDAERYWASLTRAAAQQVAGPRGAPTSPLLREHLVSTLAAAALLVFPTAPLEQVPGPGFTGPATVRRALDHLHAHAGEPLAVVDLAAAAGVGVRALQQAFVRHVGTSPSAYLQQVRLERAHADLLAGDPAAGDSVAAVAARWGFAHLGRFAAAHRARYGVPPSTTLRS